MIYSWGLKASLVSMNQHHSSGQYCARFPWHKMTKRIYFNSLWRWQYLQNASLSFICKFIPLGEVRGNHAWAWWVRVACPKPQHIAKSWIWTHDIMIRAYKPKPMGHEPPFSQGLGLDIFKNTYHSVWRVNKTAYTNRQSEQMIKRTLTFQKNTIQLRQ